MRAGLEGIIGRQGGIFARHQALECGFSPREFATLTRSGGRWTRVRYGIYAPRELWQSLDELGRLKLRDRAALMVCDEFTVLTHSSAGRFHGLPVLETDALAHVTRTSETQTTRTEAGIKHHLGIIDPTQVLTRDGLAVSNLVRTVMDMSREFGYRSGLVAADAALARGLAKSELAARAEALSCEPHAPVIRAVARDADGRAQSPLETLGRVLLVNMGIDDLELQWVIWFPEGGHAEADLYSRRLNHVFECDGRVKYRPQLDAWGRLMSAEDVLWSEKKREDKVRGRVVGVSRIYWPDVLVENFPSASARLWREIKSQHAGRLWLPPGA